MNGAFVVSTETARLEGDTWGDRTDPSVLLLAGTSCTRDWWPPAFCERLAAAGLFVTRFDQRDTGASSTWPVGEPGYALPDLADDAVAILNSFELERAHLVGFSQGAWVAQLLALDHRERVASLTLMSTRSTAHGPADPDLPEVSDALLAAWETLDEPDWNDADSVISYYVENERTLAGSAFDEQAATAICSAAVGRSRDIRAASNHLVMPQARWRERLGSLAVPTTILHGSLDPLFPLPNAESLAREIPGAELEVLDGVGHEFPERVWDTAIGAIHAHGT